jgi:hypothetical protein
MCIAKKTRRHTLQVRHLYKALVQARLGAFGHCCRKFTTAEGSTTVLTLRGADAAPHAYRLNKSRHCWLKCRQHRMNCVDPRWSNHVKKNQGAVLVSTGLASVKIASVDVMKGQCALFSGQPPP